MFLNFTIGYTTINNLLIHYLGRICGESEQRFMDDASAKLAR